MLQQTQVKTVIPYWKRWIRALPSIRSLARAKSETIHKLWEGLGYYRRVRNLQKAAWLVMKTHGGQLPSDLDQLLKLPGIGRYTAGAICSIAFNQPRPIVDGNVTRVFTRVFGISGEPRGRKVNAELWQLAEQLVGTASLLPLPKPPRYSGTSKRNSLPNTVSGQGPCSSVNQALMELGAVVCTVRQPDCQVCPLQSSCVAYRENKVSSYPSPVRRPATLRRRFAAFVVKRRQSYLVRQRPASEINGRLWEFPKAEANGESLTKTARRALGANPTSLEPLCTINHSITRYRIRLDVFRTKGLEFSKIGPGQGRWLTLPSLHRLPFSSADKKILTRLSLVITGLFFAIGSLSPAAPPTTLPPEQQLTHSAKNHVLDNNDNFSADGRFLCYDTRETFGSGLENSRSIEKVEIATGRETVLYEAKRFISGAQAAPGIAAVSFSPVENKVVFIHGPLLEEVPVRGYYDKPNRQGAEVVADGKGLLTWLDKRDVDTTRDTIAGAHRGGTHRHEYSLDGKRVGFTYDDFILTQYERTVGYMERNAKAPAPALCYFAVLVPVVPRGTAKTGEIERAQGDSWVGRSGLMRAFIGKVREADGTYQESLFVVDVPADVDIATADSGSPTRFPSPPKRVKIRRLTHAHAIGSVRGTLTGDRIAYYAEGTNGKNQIFVIPSDGSDQDPNPAKRPVQLTHFPKGAGPGLRWSPAGDAVFCTTEGGIVLTSAKSGADFGKSSMLTPCGDGPVREHLVVSPDGKLLAYGRAVPTKGSNGKPFKTYKGSNPLQIFLLRVPEQ